MAIDDNDLARIVDVLRPVLVAMVQETLRAAQQDTQGVTITTATVLEVDGPDAWVAPDDTPGDEVQVTRSTGAHVEGARVFVVHYPPSGAFILPAIPDPA
jgi:hypothetical protein